MTEKIKVTQEQADAIEIYNDRETSRKAAADIYLNSKFKVHKSLDSLTFDELMTALYIGYEVEPEYSVEDWVTYWDGEKHHITKVIDVQVVNNRIQFDSISDWKSLNDVDRHATEQEIAQEKERRFWNKHGREPRQIKIGDLLIRKLNGFPRVNVDHELLPEGFLVACFAESRLDTNQ